MFKETGENNQPNDKYSAQPDRIFEAILKGEDHMT